MLSRLYPTYSSRAPTRRNEWGMFDPFHEIFNDFDTRMAQLEKNPDIKVSAFQPFGDGLVFSPPVDIYETDDGFIVSSSVPGVAPSDLNVDYDSRTRQLSISGEAGDEHTKEYKDKHQKVYERSYGNFERTIVLPETSAVDEDNIQAEIANGVLKLTIPKVKDKSSSKKSIPVTAKESDEAPKIKSKKN